MRLNIAHIAGLLVGAIIVGVIAGILHAPTMVSLISGFVLGTVYVLVFPLADYGY